MDFLKYLLVFLKRSDQILSNMAIYKCKELCVCETMAEWQDKGDNMSKYQKG